MPFKKELEMGLALFERSQQKSPPVSRRFILHAGKGISGYARFPEGIHMPEFAHS